MKRGVLFNLLVSLAIVLISTSAQAKIIKTNSRVMTYNLRYDNPHDGDQSWSHRKAGVISLIKFHGPEILSIQEGLHHQVQDLKEGLEHYDYVGVGRDNGDEKGEYAAIFYDSEKYSKVESGNFWLSPTPNKASIGWDAACIRICTWVKLRDKVTRQLLFVFNTHFDHVGKEAQRNSAKLIVEKIDKLTEGRETPFVLTGDFNLTPDDKSIIYLSKEFNDSKQVTRRKPYGPDGTFNSFDFNHKLDQRIDYIFTSSEVTVERYAVLSDSKNRHYYSDHLPVLVDIRY
ncbi:endonuclease/exonuclease/phosphatase family protein [Halosquirtibacter laminarini]|uniref:Endonuclease/exonuclease/phosphatase family protein n=1 Tax=Halosquirtibacter laminarini TaxID=3374600 RepID=A0AC61NDP5_9BACT|nr:endonuclease/exonuclease/phosphatase family protein [Prolixibacteraceae bacterium]